MILPLIFCVYDALAMGICAALSIFSMKIPYPVDESLISTCVTAPTSLPFWIMGLPLRSVVRKGQLFAKTEYVKVPIEYRTDRHIIRKVNVYSVKADLTYLIYKFFIQAGVKYFLPQSSIKIRSSTPYI